jgi:hypothetical protein
MNSVVAGDTVNVKSVLSYNEVATIDIAGTNTAPIRFRGYTISPGDGGLATISGQNVRANCLVNSLAANTRIYYVFENIAFTNATGVGVLLDINATFWKKCTFDEHTSHGFQGGAALFERCFFQNNTAGARIDRKSATFIGCRFKDLVTGITHDGLADAAVTVLFCDFVSVSGDAVQSNVGNDMYVTVVNCTIDGDAKDTTNAVNLGATRHLACIVNNVIYDCSTGIQAADQKSALISRNNLVNANTLNYDVFQTTEGEVTAAPAFQDEAGADYRPSAGSPMLNAGFDANAVVGTTSKQVIGAHTTETSAVAPGEHGIKTGGQL